MGEDICELENDDNNTTKSPTSNGHMASSPIKNGKIDGNNETHSLLDQHKANTTVSPTKSGKFSYQITPNMT
jgi:hypothetical protein